MNSDPTSQAEALATFRADVVSGLRNEKKTLPCKYFYDETGSQLFDQICELDEYYLTRTELGIMREHSEAIAAQIDERVMLVEYGSGSSIKTRILLESLIDPVAYVPVDISEEHLLNTAEGLKIAFPDLEVLPVVADFTKSFHLPTPSRPYSHVALYFPGSTIGNFTPEYAGEILEEMAKRVGPGGGMLIGIDLQKDVDTLVAAYDDAAGVTAEFNLNLLRRINGELDGDFDLDQFSHKAIYNDVDHRIEISIVSNQDQVVSIGDEQFEFHKDEEILTEFSHKYRVDDFAQFATAYGFQLHRYWTDERSFFGVLHLVQEASN